MNIDEKECNLGYLFFVNPQSLEFWHLILNLDAVHTTL